LRYVRSTCPVKTLKKSPKTQRMLFYTEKNLTAWYNTIGELAGFPVLRGENWHKILIPSCSWPKLYYSINFPPGEETVATASLLEQLSAADAPGVVLCQTGASVATRQSLRKHALAEKSWAAMAMDLQTVASEGSPLPEDFEIGILSEKEAIPAWCKVVDTALMGGIGLNCTLFEKMMASPRFQFLQATFKGRAVASCLLFFHEDTAGLYLIGTLPDFQGKGYGTAITAFGLNQSKKAGARYALLQATPAGEPVYARLGFRKEAEHAVFRLK